VLTDLLLFIGGGVLSRGCRKGLRDHGIPALTSHWFSRIFMTIRIRILALLSLLSLFCIGTTQYFKRLHANEEVFDRELRVRQMSTRLQRLVGAISRPALRYLHDYSERSGMVEFLAHPDPAWAEKNIRGVLDQYRLDSVWVLDANRNVIYGRDRRTDSALTALPLPAGELAALLQRNEAFDFHAFVGVKHYQIQGMPINAPAVLERQGAPPGWLIAATLWDELVLRDLADAAQGRVTVTPSTHVNDALPEIELEVWQPLLDCRGRAIAGLDYHMIDPQGEDPAMEEIELSLFILNGAGAIVLVGVLMHFLILRPFSILRASLVGSDPVLLAPLLRQQDEFGQIARIVQTSMRDREQLQQSLEERLRLGRELHDGAIQSIYGTGMALSRVQSLMGRDLPAANALLDETRDELNRVILDLRRHIDQADPKPLDTSFGEAVARLIQQLHGPGPVGTELNIDEDLVSSHPMLQRSQTLQFVREAISNAVRHGRPTRLAVSWQRTPEGSVLTVGDDGVGFDPKTIKAGGRGLANLSERALSLGGHLEIDSGHNKGTRICLKLPTPKAPL
jgi:signal transduction histidine kinase